MRPIQQFKKGGSVKKTLLITGAVLLVLLLLFFGTMKLMNSREFQVFGNMTNRVETNQKAVALTFDDGPTKNVDQLLPLLARYNAKATFFLIGKDMEQYPDAIKQIAAAGHQIGNHTYSHNRMVFKSPSYIKNEIEKTDQLIRSSGYEAKIDFRPPYGKKLLLLPYYLSKHNRDTILWDMEPDTNYNTAAGKVNDVLAHVQPGSIILMHPMYDKTGEELQAIQEILEALTAQGYRFVTVEELRSL